MQPETDPNLLTLQQLRDLRSRVAQGEEVEPEELRKVLDSIRTSQRAAAGSGGKRKKSPGPTINIDSDKLLNDFTVG